MTPAEFPDVLTLDQAAEYLQVSVDWLSTRVRDDDGPPHRWLGPRILRFRRDLLLEWVNGETVGAGLRAVK